jgi:hypothetical protein
MRLACIAHKSLDDRRDLEAMQAVAAKLSGYAGKFRCFFQRRVKKPSVWIP